MRIIQRTQIMPVAFGSVGQVVQLTEGARIIHFGRQDGDLFIWVELNPDAPKAVFMFRVMGAGLPIKDNWHHRGTCSDDGFVWHLYSMGEA